MRVPPQGCIYIYIGVELRTHIVTHIIVQLHLSFILSVDLLHLLDSFQAVMARIAKLVVALPYIYIYSPPKQVVWLTELTL